MTTDSSQAQVDPRIERTRRVVVDTARDLLTERGFGRVTVEGIAERCGVARSTIYRHWPSLNELLMVAVREHIQADQVPDTGDLRRDLLLLFGELAGALDPRGDGCIVASLIAEAIRNPELAELHARFTTERRNRSLQVMERGRQRGELPENVDLDQLSRDLAAAFFFRALIFHEPIDEAFVERTVDRWLANPPLLS